MSMILSNFCFAMNTYKSSSDQFLFRKYMEFVFEIGIPTRKTGGEGRGCPIRSETKGGGSSRKRQSRSEWLAFHSASLGYYATILTLLG